MPAPFNALRVPPLPRLQSMGAEAAIALLDRHERELARIEGDPMSSTDQRRRAREKLPRVRSLRRSIETGETARVSVTMLALRGLLAELEASADEIDTNTAAGAFEPDEASEREGFAAGIRHALNAIEVELLGGKGGRE